MTSAGADLPSFGVTTLTDDFSFGEGPRWRDDRIWCADMFRNRVQTVDLSGGIEVLGELRRPSGLGFQPDGSLVAVAMESATVNVLRDGRFEVLHAADFDGTHTANDLLVMPSGDMYLDCYPKIPGYTPVDKVVHIAPDGVIKVVADGLRRPNGIVSDPDGRWLFVAETFGQRVLRFPIAPDMSLGEPVVLSELPGRYPDGLALDAEGGLWIGSFSTGEFLRIDASGRLTHRIAIPGRWSVAPLLGGSDGRSLFMFTAETELETEFRQGISKGFVQVARVDVPAAGF